MESLNPLKRFPSKTSRLAPYFRSLDGPSQSVEKTNREIEKRERWLQMDRLDPSFGLAAPSYSSSSSSHGEDTPAHEVFIRRTFRRMESSGLFNPPRMGASLSELSEPPPPTQKRFVLVEESRLRELAQIEAILREEKDLLGEQCSWIMSDYHIDSRIPIPATRVAVNNLCEADMKRLAREFDTLQAAWGSYARQNRYYRDISHNALPFKSYIGNAPLAMRPIKLVKLEMERMERQIKMERDSMLYEDDRAFLVNCYYRASARKKDYERYFILATRYGHMDESEFHKDERPGRRYWVRALDGCIKFQKIWGAFWAVQSLRRYKGAKHFQKIVRGFLAWIKFHPLIVFRLKYGKSSYLKYSMHKWREYIHMIKWCRESIAWLMVNWADKCMEHWKIYTKQSKDKKIQKARRIFAQFLNAGLLRCFRAWAFMAQRQVYIKQRARRILGACGPQFDLWSEYVETSKHMRKMFKTTSLIQSIARMYLHRRVFKAKRKLGFRLGIVMRCRCLTENLRNAAVSVDFAEWNAATEERRALAALEVERSRLNDLQAAVVARENAVRVEMRKHLRSKHGRTQLKDAATSMLSSEAFQKEQEEKVLYSRCLELGKRFAQRDFLVARPPLFKCVDPTCCTTFTSEEQYHLHFKNAPNHGGKKVALGSGKKTGNAGGILPCPPGGEDVNNPNQITLKSRKRVTADMKFLDRERAFQVEYAPFKARFETDGAAARTAISNLELLIATKKDGLEKMEQDNKSTKLDYVKESKSIKLQLQALEQGEVLTKHEQIKKLTELQTDMTKKYASTKTSHTSTVSQAQKEIERCQIELTAKLEEFGELEAEYNEATAKYDAAVAQLASDKEAARLKAEQEAEAARKKQEAEDADFHSKLSYSSLHCLLLHPAEFIALRHYLLGLLPDDAVVRPPGPTPEEIMKAEAEAASLKALEEMARAEAEAAAAASIVKVKGWTFVKGKGWVASKPDPKALKGGKRGKDATKAQVDKGKDKQSERRNREIFRKASTLDQHMGAVAADPTGEPRRRNSMPEVHLLNCLDLWKAIELWKIQVATTDPAYMRRAMFIFETYLAPETAEEIAAAEHQIPGNPFSGEQQNGGTVVRASGRLHAGQRIAGIAKFVGRLWSKVPFFRRKDGQDNDSDIESDLDSDSSDDEDTRTSKRTKRTLREEEARRSVIVKRTVDLSVMVDKSFTRQSADDLLCRLSLVLSKFKGQKKVDVKFHHEFKQKNLSWWRRMFRVKPKSYNAWTDAYVIPPNIFDDMQWALFKYLFEKVHNQSGFERSPDFMHYRVLCAQDDAEHEKLLFNEAKLVRFDKFKSWSRAEFAPVHRAQYRMASQCASGAMDVVTESLVDRALLACIDEYVWRTSLDDQMYREASNMVSDDVCFWIETRLADEWYDSNVEAYIKRLIDMGGDMRAMLMEVAGMRESDFSTKIKVKKAFNVSEVKSSANLLNSFLNAADEPLQGGGDIPKAEEASRVEAKKADLADLATTSKNPVKPSEEKKLTNAQKALLDMQRMGIAADRSMLPIAGLTGDGLSGTNPEKAGGGKSSLDRQTAVKRIQQRVRGIQGRKKARSVFAKVWLKRFDNAQNATFYCNVQTNHSQWIPPRIYRTLFPWSKKQW